MCKYKIRDRKCEVLMALTKLSHYKDLCSPKQTSSAVCINETENLNKNHQHSRETCNRL